MEKKPITRRGALKGIGSTYIGGALVFGTVSTLAIKKAEAKKHMTFLTPEQYGAIGDGVAHDGPAWVALINALNALPLTTTAVINANGHYLLAGTPPREMAPARFARNTGVCHGLPAITRDNVAINANNSQFIVPDDIMFRRIVRGGSDDDSFFVLFQFRGDNCTLNGGVLDGALERRPVTRGPRPFGFGGLEFALVMEGANWALNGVTAKNWGTDCLLITNAGQALDCHFHGARRNGISVVADVEIPPENPVVIRGGSLKNNGNWPDDIYNNPGAGAVVEAGRSAKRASVIFEDITFANNKLKDLQLAHKSYKCQVRGNRFEKDLKLRPKQAGGHIIEDNIFSPHSQILVSTTTKGALPVIIRNNKTPTGGRFDRIRHTRTKVKNSHHTQKINRH